MNELQEQAEHRKKIGQKVAQLRERRGLSQQALAELAGVDLQLLVQIEQGATDFLMDRLFLLLRALGTSPRDFFSDFT